MQNINWLKTVTPTECRGAAPTTANRPEVAGNKTRKPYNAVLQGIDISRANKYVQRKRNAIHLYARVPYIYIKRQTTLIDGLPRCSVYFVWYSVNAGRTFVS